MKIRLNFISIVILSFIFIRISQIQIKAQTIDTIFSADIIGSIEVIKNDPGSLLLTNNISCVSKSTDYGANWAVSNFDTIPGCLDLSFNTEDNNIGLLATGAALSKTTDGGTNWFYTNQLDYTFSVNINPHFPNIIFVWGTEDIGLGPYHFYRSEDGGLTWEDSTGELIVIDPQFHSDSSNIAYAYNTNSIIKTTDTGNSWVSILNVGSGIRFTSIRINHSAPNILYSSSIGSLYKTTNNGEYWYNIDSALKVLEPDFHISSIWIDERVDNRLYLGLSNYSNSLTGLFLTEDDGKSWKQIYSEAIFHVEADRESPRNIYCVADDNYKNIAIKLLDTFHVTGINEVKGIQPDGYYLYQNYPNPFNSSTTIKYNIPELSFITLKVYDILGNEIGRLVNKEQPAGSYEINFNAIDLLSGIYFYRLQTERFVETKKMVLLR